MKNTIAYICCSLIIFSFFSTIIPFSYIYSQQQALGKVRVFREGAVLRVLPDENSTIIKKLPLGSILNTQGTAGEWFKIILPLDQDGFEIVGYVNYLFIEQELLPGKKEPVKIPVPQAEQKTQTNPSSTISKETTSKIGTEDYIDWKKRLSIAKNKQSTGLVIAILGVVIAIPSIYYTFYNTYGLTDKYENPLSLTGGGWAAAIIGDVLAIGGIVAGIIMGSSGAAAENQLNEEGILKGYNVKVGLIANNSIFGITIGLSF